MIKTPRNRAPSNRGYFIFAGGCVLGAILLIGLLFMAKCAALGEGQISSIRVK